MINSKAQHFPKLCFPAGSELPSTTGTETAELGAEMQILFFFLCQPPKWAEPPGQEQPPAQNCPLTPVSHPFFKPFWCCRFLSPVLLPSFVPAPACDLLPGDTTLLLSSPKTFLKHLTAPLKSLPLMQLLFCISKQPGPDTEALLFHLLQAQSIFPQSPAANRLEGRCLE